MTIKDDYLQLAARKVDEATQARLHFSEETANQLLREAADLYMQAGETQEAQACRMLIVTD
jgi:hypothetical protein